MKTIPDEVLGASDIPNEAVDLGDIWRFALTKDGYDEAGGFEPLAEMANNASRAFAVSKLVPTQLDVLRLCLFFEARRYRHFGEDPDADGEAYIRALVGAVRGHRPE